MTWNVPSTLSYVQQYTMDIHNDLAFTTQVSPSICCEAADQVQLKSVTLNPIMDPLNVSSPVPMPRNAYRGL